MARPTVINGYSRINPARESGAFSSQVFRQAPLSLFAVADQRPPAASFALSAVVDTFSAFAVIVLPRVPVSPAISMRRALASSRFGNVTRNTPLRYSAVAVSPETV